VNVSLAFDDQTYKTFQEMQATAGLDSDAAMIQLALRVVLTLQRLAKEGYSEVLVEHEESHLQKPIEMPPLVNQQYAA
jgi:hypothetical protein